MKAENTQVGKVLLSEEAIYGLILVAGMIIIGRNSAGTSLDALIAVLITMIIFFAGHVYAATIATLGRVNNELTTWQSLVSALRQASGMILIALIPIGMLSLGVSHLIEDDVAVWLALFVDACLLGVVGWLVASHKTPRFWLRMAGALVTSSFGLALISLKAFFYH